MDGVADSAKWLSLRIDLDFEKVSLDNVLKYIAEVLPSVSIIVDPNVAASGIDLSTRVVDFKGKAVAVGDVLEIILGADLAYVPRAGHLLITTSDRLYLSLECKTYAVGVTCRWQELLSIVKQAVNNLADRYVAPWLDEGGTATIEHGNGVLIVTQTHRGHQQIAGLLEQLDARGFFDAGQHADKTSGMSEDAAKTTVVSCEEALAAHIGGAAGPRKEGTWNVVPILCPYDGRLAEALRRICPNVNEAHDELGSLRDYKQALFVHSLPVIMEMPPDPWFYPDATPRPCAWNDLTDADLAKGEQLENIQWDSQPVALFAGECERAGKPLALGQWSDPFRIGRDWQSQTGFLEEHQHRDLAGGIVQGRFLAVAFVEQVLVDRRFKVWCALWEQYRKSGEVPVLEHEKAAREWGAAIPERKTIWDHLPYVIGLACPRMYTATALHYLLPVKEEGVVDYGPVCSDGVAFDCSRAIEPFHNPRPADGVNWLSGDKMRLFGPVGVMVDAAGSEVAVARMYGLAPSQVRILPLITSQAGDWLAVTFRVGQGAILLLPECRDEGAKAKLVVKLATELWEPIQGWLQESPVSTEQATEKSANRISLPSGGERPSAAEEATTTPDRAGGAAAPAQPARRKGYAMSNDSTRKAAALRKVAEALRAWGEFKGANSPEAREAARTALDLATHYLRIIMEASITYGRHVPTAQALEWVQEAAAKRGRMDFGGYCCWWQQLTQPHLCGSPDPVGFPDDLEHWADELEKAGSVAAPPEGPEVPPPHGAAHDGKQSGTAPPPPPDAGYKGEKAIPRIMGPEYVPRPGEDWSIPMSMTEIARRLGSDPRTAEDLLAKTGLWRPSRQNWRVRLDTLAPTMKKKVTTQPKGNTE